MYVAVTTIQYTALQPYSTLHSFGDYYYHINFFMEPGVYMCMYTMYTLCTSLLSSSPPPLSTGLTNGHIKEGKFQKWKRRFSESLLRLGSSSGSLDNRSPSRSPSAHLSTSTDRPRSLVRGYLWGERDLTVCPMVHSHTSACCVIGKRLYREL